MQYKSTSTMAVHTESSAWEPDFQVPIPTAGILCPLNSLKVFIFSPPCEKVTWTWAISNFFFFFLFVFFVNSVTIKQERIFIYLDQRRWEKSLESRLRKREGESPEMHATWNCKPEQPVLERATIFGHVSFFACFDTFFLILLSPGMEWILSNFSFPNTFLLLFRSP